MKKALMVPRNQMNYMEMALKQAHIAAQKGEVPVGAVLVHENQVIAVFGNELRSRSDPTAHAEMLAIRAAAKKLGEIRMPECDLYVTLEPCPMCAQAISLARIRRLYFGAYDPKGGGIEHGPRIFEHATCHHRPEVMGGIQEKECAKVLVDFFENRRFSIPAIIQDVGRKKRVSGRSVLGRT